MSARSRYFNCPEGLLLAQQFGRERRQIRATIKGIEPRAKHSMPINDKLEIQRRLLQELIRQRRSAFRGPLALRLRLSTTHKTPTHLHHIAKNLLDLFSKPALALSTRRRSLLYLDNKQIHALAVTCHHGAEAPEISVDVRPLRDLCEELYLIEQSSDRVEDDDDHAFSSLGDEMNRVLDLLEDEAFLRSSMGDANFEAMLFASRQSAQEQLFGGRHVALTPYDLALLYDVAGYGSGLDGVWETTFALSSARIILSEPPQVEGGSNLLKKEIEEKLLAFKARYDWLINPLLIPVALEVLIKPPPVSRQRGLHDLDNVLRTYLIPRFVDLLSQFRILPSRSMRVVRDHHLRPGEASRATRFGLSHLPMKVLRGSLVWQL